MRLGLNYPRRVQSQAQKILLDDAEISAFSIGSGPDLIFLHGGPGDTHHYMKRMAEPLFRNFRCIFFDQRGTGDSRVFRREPGSFGMESLFQDLAAVQDHFNAPAASLVGHSWGAMLGLFALIRFPERFSKAALISMGPLDPEMGRRTAEHLTSVLTESEKADWKDWRLLRNQARDRGDRDLVLKYDRKMMSLRVKAWVFNPELRELFLNEYFQDPPPDRDVNKWIWSAAETWFSWDKVENLLAKVWLCAGQNDSVPLEQVTRLQTQMPNAQVRIFPNCGHLPWLESPLSFYEELEIFLGSEP